MFDLLAAMSATTDLYKPFKRSVLYEYDQGRMNFRVDDKENPGFDGLKMYWPDWSSQEYMQSMRQQFFREIQKTVGAMEYQQSSHGGN
jgi:lysyl-tRNA synthetase class II